MSEKESMKSIFESEVDKRILNMQIAALTLKYSLSRLVVEELKRTSWPTQS